MVKRDISLHNEITRKILHIIAGMAFVAVALVVERSFGKTVLLWLIFIALLVSLVTDYLRVECGWKLRGFAFLERAREVGRLHATTYTFIGALLAFIFFDRDIAYAGILMFFLGDAAAAIFGRVWGRRKFIGKKSVLGTSVMLVISLVVGVAILRDVWLAIIMALSATIVEALVEKMDDSFLIILFSGIVAQFLRFI
jgi:dolichol kinase